MVTHPWYVFHIPGTNAYVPIWTIAGFLLVLVIVVAIAGAHSASQCPASAKIKLVPSSG